MVKLSAQKNKNGKKVTESADEKEEEVLNIESADEKDDEDESDGEESEEMYISINAPSTCTVANSVQVHRREDLDPPVQREWRHPLPDQVGGIREGGRSHLGARREP